MSCRLGRFRDCSTKTRRGKRGRVPKSQSRPRLRLPRLFSSSSRGSENLRYIIVVFVIAFVVPERGRSEGGREGRRATKKCLDFWGNSERASEWPRGIPPKLASLPPSSDYFTYSMPPPLPPLALFGSVATGDCMWSIVNFHWPLFYSDRRIETSGLWFTLSFRKLSYSGLA